MKALVMELKDGKAAILTDKGTFEIIKDTGYEIGQRIDVDAAMFLSSVTQEDIELEIELQQETENEASGTINAQGISAKQEEPKSSDNNGDNYIATPYRKNNIKPITKTSKMLRRIAAAIAVAVITGGGAASYAAPVSTISVDVNPSLEMKLNVFDRVISVNAYNENDKELAESINKSAKGKRLQDALQIALSNLRDNDYITEADTSVVTSVYTHFGKDDELKKKLETSALEWNEGQDNNNLSGKVDIENVDVDKKTRQDAARKNISPGKLYKANEVENAYEEAGKDTDEDWIDKSVDEINNAIEKIKEKTKEESKEQPKEQPQKQMQEQSDNDKVDNSNYLQKNAKGNEPSANNNDKSESTHDNSKDNNGINSGNETAPNNSSDRESGNTKSNDREDIKPGNTERDNMQTPSDGNGRENDISPVNDMDQGGGMIP